MPGLDDAHVTTNAGRSPQTALAPRDRLGVGTAMVSTFSPDVRPGGYARSRDQPGRVGDCASLPSPRGFAAHGEPAA